MNYYARLLKMRSFRKAPVRTIGRAVQLAGLIAMKKDARITVGFGSNTFDFNYVHGERFGGGRGLFLGRERIEDLLEFGDRFLKVGDTVIDGGANQGVFTTAFGSYVGPVGRVVAIEPMPYAVERVKNNAKLNNMSDRVSVVQGALSDEIGTASLDLSHGVGAASITNDYGGSQQRLDVETLTIDSIVEDKGLKQVDFIKLDIEGAELKALKGAAKTLEKHRPILCLEISTGSGTGAELQAHEHLLDIGYHAYHFEDRKLVPLVHLNPPHENVFYMSN